MKLYCEETQKGEIRAHRLLGPSKRNKHMRPQKLQQKRFNLVFLPNNSCNKIHSFSLSFSPVTILGVVKYQPIKIRQLPTCEPRVTSYKTTSQIAHLVNIFIHCIKSLNLLCLCDNMFLTLFTEKIRKLWKKRKFYLEKEKLKYREQIWKN